MFVASTAEFEVCIVSTAQSQWEKTEHPDIIHHNYMTDGTP